MISFCMYCKKEITGSKARMSGDDWYCYPKCDNPYSGTYPSQCNTRIQKEIQADTKQDTFNTILSECSRIHDVKKHDYAQDDNTYSNFERAAIIASWFSGSTDKVFATMIGIKLARLAELRNGKVAKNESIKDTGIDLSNYCLIWTAFIEDSRDKSFDLMKQKIEEYTDILSNQTLGPLDEMIRLNKEMKDELDKGLK